jgi:hypothetical protein
VGEGGFGDAELVGDELHPGFIRPTRPVKQEHGGGVSGKGPVGEGVNEAVAHKLLQE